MPRTDDVVSSQISGRAGAEELSGAAARHAVVVQCGQWITSKVDVAARHLSKCATDETLYRDPSHESTTSRATFTEVLMAEAASLKSLGRLAAQKRGKVGIRATARAIGLSPATLSRVENGQLPDLANFTKLCQWLELDPASVLGFDPANLDRPTVAVHFRGGRTMDVDTAVALQDLILAAQRMLTDEAEPD